MVDAKPPLTNFQGEVDRGRAHDPAPSGIPHITNLFFFILTKNCCMLHPTLKNKIILALLKVVCPCDPYLVHFIFKVQDPIYMLTSIEYISKSSGFHFLK
jgi:hypothetical protein